MEKADDITIKKSLHPNSIHEYLHKLEMGTDYHMKIKLTSTGVKRCESEFLLARGLHVSAAGDGFIEMEILQSTLAWVAEYLLLLGKHATVLEPPELVDLIKEKTSELYHHYCDI